VTRWLLISCSLAVLLGVGGCSSSSDGMMTRAELAADSDDYCRSGSPTGLALLGSPQAAYSQCMQERYTTGASGFRSEDSFEAGQPSSLSAVGR
jgi:hypothetical protein